MSNGSDLTKHPAWRPENAEFSIGADGFLYYGLAKLSIKVVNGKIEFFIDQRHLQAKYGDRITISAAELSELCRHQALDNSFGL